MEHIPLEQLKKLLKEEQVSVTLAYGADGAADAENGAENSTAEISLQWVLQFDANDIADGGNVRLTARGFTVTAGTQSSECRNWDELLRRLKDMGAVTEAGAALLSIGGGFETIAAYEANKAFDALDMRGIVGKYRPLADSFELVGEIPEGSWLTQAQAEELIAGCAREAKERAYEYYEMLSEKERTQLPSFDEVWRTAYAEGQAHAARAERGELGGESPFLCDLVHRNKTHFSEPQEFCWHLYHSVSLIFEQAYEIGRYVGGVDADNFPCDPKYAPLKPYLLSVTPTCSWHCTQTSQPHYVYRFRLTDETAAWLLQYRSDYDLEELQDLAFYRGEKLLFSSCTHEGFHNDFSEEA